MEEFIDAVVDELKREAQRYPIQERARTLYDLYMMIHYRVDRIMAEMAEQAREEKRSAADEKGGD